jgi:hypothetical protein
MALHEIKMEIPAGAADAANDVLLEHACENWNVLEDAIAKRAWVAGICADEREAGEQWAAIAPLLATAGVVPFGEKVSRGESRAGRRRLARQLQGAFSRVEIRAIALGAGMGACHVCAAAGRRRALA